MAGQRGKLSIKSLKSDQPFSQAFARQMFGLSAQAAEALYIPGTAEDFERYAPDYLDGQSVSGVQRKLLMRVEEGKLVPARRGGNYIAKPAPKPLPHLPENEHAMMQLARFTGFDVALNALVPFENGELCFVTHRFDYLADGRKLFIEDAASLCNVISRHKGSDALSYEQTLIKLFRASGLNKAVLLNGFRQVLFAYLIGNNDLHLKNFSMYRNPDDATTRMVDFTPLYDVVSVAPYEQYYAEDLTLSLLHSETDAVFSWAYDQFGFYTRYDFLELAERTGLGEKAGNQVVNQIIRSVKKHLVPVLKYSQCPTDISERIHRHILDRISRLQRDLPQ